jgi:hypothetical protein
VGAAEAFPCKPRGHSSLPSMHCGPNVLCQRQRAGTSPSLAPRSSGHLAEGTLGNSNAAACLQSCWLPREVPGLQRTLTHGGEAELMGTTGNKVPREPGERDMGLRSHRTFREHKVVGQGSAKDVLSLASL